MKEIHYLDACGPEGMRVYAIGDVHGRYDCLCAMHELIGRDLDARPASDWRIIHLGDYVDRGPQSAEVVDLLARRTGADSRILALKGNHDQSFVDFLGGAGPFYLFMNFGGVETARSYGVEADFSSEAGLELTRRRLAEAVPEDHRSFLAALPLSVSFGDFFFCHAGIEPQVALDRQDPETLIWIRDAFLRWPKLHSKVIVHGHTPVPEPEVMANRVNCDTMAFRTGRLTAFVIDGQEKRFMTATCPPTM